MRLTKQTSDAVKILTLCARAEVDAAPLKVAVIAEAAGITRQLGLKLVNALAHLGYVTTVRGPRGGIRLARPAAEIPVGSVVRDFEQRRTAGDVNVGDDLHPMLDSAFEAFVAVLDLHTIADLAAREPVSEHGSSDVGPGDDRLSADAAMAPASVVPGQSPPLAAQASTQPAARAQKPAAQRAPRERARPTKSATRPSGP